MSARTTITAVAASVVLATALVAQDTGGRRLSIGVSERVEAVRNPNFVPGSDNTRLRADTNLSFSASSVTRTQSLRLSSGIALRALRDPGRDVTFEVTDPDLRLTYERTAKNSSFEASAFYSSEDIAFIRTIDDFIDDDGVLVLPDDFEDLRGTGNRLTYGGSAALRWGLEGPLGLGLSAGYRAVDYQDASAALFDTRTRWAAVDTRLEPVRGRRLTARLRFERYENDSPLTADRDTIDLDTRATLDRPDGSVYATFGLTDVPRGTRFSAGAGWSRDLPSGQLNLSAAGTLTTRDTLVLTGRASVRQVYAFGTLNAQVYRSVTEDTNNAEEAVTAATVSFSRDLTPLTGLSLGADFTRSTLLVNDQSTSTAVISATVRHQLTPDWSLNAGYDRRFRNEEAANSGWVGSDRVFLGISRSFDRRF